jgi:hypothetical protein
MLDNEIESEGIGSTHSGAQILLAGGPQPRQQGLPATGFLEFRQLLANAENDIDRRQSSPIVLAKIPRFKIHRSKTLRMVIFPSTIFATVTSFRCY